MKLFCCYYCFVCSCYFGYVQLNVTTRLTFMMLKDDLNGVTLAMEYLEPSKTV